jgi:hypothetical protein
VPNPSTAETLPQQGFQAGRQGRGRTYCRLCTGGATDQAEGLTKMESSIPFRLASYSSTEGPIPLVLLTM